MTFQSKSFGTLDADRLKDARPSAILVDGSLAKSLPAIFQAAPSVPVVVYTTAAIDSLGDFRSSQLYVVAPPKYPTDAARQIHLDYERTLKSPAAVGLLLYAASAVQIIQAASRKDGSVPLETLAMYKFDTLLGSIAFARNGDAKGSGTGSVAYKSEKSGYIASSTTGSTSCKCQDTDCCKTECCEKEGCDSTKNQCKNVSCTNS